VFAELANVSTAGTGPVPPDGVPGMWAALVANKSSPRSEAVLNIDSKSGLGVLRQVRRERRESVLQCAH
jgi:hypothetical protein